jgi:benzoate membrane transport protein
MIIPLTIIVVAVLAIPLATADVLTLTPHQTGSWLFALYAIPGLLGLLLSRLPLFLGRNAALVPFLALLTGQVRYTDLLGATLVGGAVVALLAILGLTTRVAALVPAPVVFAVVAASVLPFVIRVFDALGQEPVAIAGTLLSSAPASLSSLNSRPCRHSRHLVKLTATAGDLNTIWTVRVSFVKSVLPTRR